MNLLHVGLLVLAASVILPIWLLQSARKSLSADELLLVERNNEPVWRVVLFISIPGVVAYWLLGRYPQYSATIFTVALLVVCIYSALMVRRMRIRMIKAGVPQHFVSAFLRSQVVSQVVFLIAIVAIVYAMYPKSHRG